MNRQGEGATQGLDGGCLEGGLWRRVKLSGLFPITFENFLGRLGQGAKGVGELNLSLRRLVPLFLVFLIDEMNSKIVVAGVSGE